MRQPDAWGHFTDAFLDELVDWIDGRTVLEVFAGNGLLASMLAARGVDVVATTLFRGHDGHERGMHFPVLEMRASQAARVYADREVLLMSWPTADEGAMQASIVWGEERPIVFIGEVTVLDENILGGCASDLFFELTEELRTFDAYEPTNMIERAAVRQLRDGATLEFQRRIDDHMEEVAARMGIR